MVLTVSGSLGRVGNQFELPRSWLPRLQANLKQQQPQSQRAAASLLFLFSATVERGLAPALERYPLHGSTPGSNCEISTQFWVSVPSERAGPVNG